MFIPCTFLLGLHRVNRLAGGSLRTVAAILVRIQAERKCGDLVLLCVNNFIPCTFLPGCAGEPACRWLSTHGYDDFSSHTSGTGEWGL